MQPPEAPPLDSGGQGSASASGSGNGSVGAVAGARGNRSGTGAGIGPGSGTASANGYGLLEGLDGGHTSATPSSKRKAPPPTPPSKSDDADKASTAGNHQKRRRRVFSCQSCQRLKCRCEYDPGAQACHRCVTLRIECSLKGEILDVPSHPKPAESGSSLEERFARYEKSLADMKGMLELVTRQFGVPGDSRRPPRGITSSRTNTEAPNSPKDEDGGPESLADPVDVGIKSAPTAVLREIGEQVNQGFRRLEHVKLDLVQLQLLEEQTANELARLFLRRHGHLLAVYDPAETSPSDIRELSPFLHSVCCLCAMLYREDLCNTPVHRQVYEQVRITMGQTLLSNPLSLEEINGVLIMSDHVDGSEYIDSWLLTGYCVKQAMLSISFSKIVANIKRGVATVPDRQAIHLWSTICLHHLHWAATTGRPSVLQVPYINQCNILLSFYQASMQDGMLVAEILLYSTLHQKLARRSYLDKNGECEEFKAWKQKWNHLMSLPTASMLRIGYYAACLILALRALEESGEAMDPKSFLSNLAFDSPASGHEALEPRPSKKDAPTLQVHTAKYAHSVLETFVDMPAFLMDTIPTYLCLCIGYSALMLAHYDESQSKVSAAASISLISRLEDWCMRTPSKTWAVKFAKLARQRVQSRTGSVCSYDDEQKQGRRPVPAWADASMAIPSFPLTAEHGNAPSASFQARFGASDFAAGTAEAYTMPHDSMHHGFEVAHSAIPSMEDFFGGGFLDFMRQPRG